MDARLKYKLTITLVKECCVLGLLKNCCQKVYYGSQQQLVQSMPSCKNCLKSRNHDTPITVTVAWKIDHTFNAALAKQATR